MSGAAQDSRHSSQTKSPLAASVARKILMALSGLALVGFLVTHLAANLLLFKSEGSAFNRYTESLEALGPLKTILELGLAGVFVLHIVTAVHLKLNHRQARPDGYRVWKSKKIVTSNPASRNMAVTGLVILAFLIAHIIQFRFGPNVDQGYVAQVDGKSVRDMYRLVVETFRNPVFVGLYVAVLLFVAGHLRHGFWSAFQSLGMMNRKLTPVIYALGAFIAIALAGGFLLIPPYLFFTQPH